jgi:hypothetical protein
LRRLFFHAILVCGFFILIGSHSFEFLNQKLLPP